MSLERSTRDEDGDSLKPWLSEIREKATKHPDANYVIAYSTAVLADDRREALNVGWRAGKLGLTIIVANQWGAQLPYSMGVIGDPM